MPDNDEEKFPNEWSAPLPPKSQERGSVNTLEKTEKGMDYVKKTYYSPDANAINGKSHKGWSGDEVEVSQVLDRRITPEPSIPSIAVKPQETPKKEEAKVDTIKPKEPLEKAA